MFETRNDLPQETREKVVSLLNLRLADAIDLQAQCKQAHWNVKGPDFIALHKLFDDVNASVVGYVDLLAERIVQLGGVAEGELRTVVRRSAMAPYPASAVSGEEHVNALAGALAAFGKVVRKDIATVLELGDQGTGDILIEISRGLDKWLWFVEAHVQKTAVASAR
jgi:starvation-inducible DNA-binding protein